MVIVIKLVMKLPFYLNKKISDCLIAKRYVGRDIKQLLEKSCAGAHHPGANNNFVFMIQPGFHDKVPK